MERKAKPADGVPAWQPVCDPVSIRSAVCNDEACVGPWIVGPNGRDGDGWGLIATGLMRSLAMLPWNDVARLTDGTLSSSQRRNEAGLVLMGSDAANENRAGNVASDALRLCYGPGVCVGGESG